MTDILVYTEEQDNVIAGSVEPREIVVAVVGEVGGGSGDGGAVDSVNGMIGHVVLDAADVGADAAGTAAGAVAAHEAAADPHPQYTTSTEAAAAAPVQSVNTQTGEVVLDAADVGAEPAGAVTAHNVATDAHADIRAWADEIAVGALTTGLLNHNNGAYLAALNDTTLRVNPVPNVFFSELVGLVDDPTIDFAQQDVPLSSISLPADGVYIRFVGINVSGVVSFQSVAINTDAGRAQLGIVYVKRVSGVNSFIDGAAGPRNVKTIPILSNVSYTDRAYHELRSTVGLAPNADLTMKLSAGHVHGEAINWGDPTDVNTKAVPAADPMSFLLFSAGTGATGVVPAPTTLFDPTKYWDGTTLVTLSSTNKASVQRVLITITGTVIVQYGEVEYASLADAAASMYTSPFTRIFDDLLAVEIARVAMSRSCVNLQDTAKARVVLLGYGAAGASDGGGTGAVDSVNGQTGTVVLDTDDIAEGVSNLYHTDARVRDTVLTGLSLATTGAVAATDTVLQAFGKLEKTKAPLASPAFTGAPTAPTATEGSNTTQIATTEFVRTATASLVAQTITNGVTTSAPSQDAVFDALALKAPVNSPTFTGFPAAPTASPGDNTTKLATTAFVAAAQVVAQDRANHTGTQLSSTISDFNSATRTQVEAELVAGTNVTITPSGSGASRQLTISATGGADNSTETVAISSGTLNLSATTKEVVVVNLNQNVTTITMPSGVTGQAVNRRIVFTQSGAANFTVAGWGSVTVEGGVAPIAATGVGAVTEYMLSNTDNGGWRMYVDQTGGELSRGTAQATTGGTSIDFTGIPSSAKRITALMRGVSLSGTSDVLIQLMVGGVAVSTGYLSTCSALGTTTAVSQSTAGMIIRGAAAVSIISGAYTFNEISANTWVGSFAGKQSSSAGLAGAGDVSLSGEVDGIRITTANGTDTFDAGSVNIMWE